MSETANSVENKNATSGELQKPLSLIISELRLGIGELVEKSHLPAVMLEMVFKDIYNDVALMSKEYQSREIWDYKKKLEESQNKENIKE